MPTTPNKSYLDVSSEVSTALADGRPVVALESTIISHGMPYPQNVETALQVEQTVRTNGAVPATIAILNGRLKAGLTSSEIDLLGNSSVEISKASRRDIPILLARAANGSTTVAATMIIAAQAGIRVFATGGIGGVHRGAELSFDISADLDELARTNVAVVCAGIKSVLDIPRTLEYLETKGVPVIGYGTDELPAFYSRKSGSPVDYRIDTPADVAAMLQAKWAGQIDGGVIIANPVPEASALDSNNVDAVIVTAIDEMTRAGISGKDITPYLLARIAEHTKGESLAANIALILNNAAVASRIAAAFSPVET